MQYKVTEYHTVNVNTGQTSMNGRIELRDAFLSNRPDTSIVTVTTEAAKTDAKCLAVFHVKLDEQRGATLYHYYDPRELFIAHVMGGFEVVRLLRGWYEALTGERL